MKQLIVFPLVVGIMLSACTPQPEPTEAPVEEPDEGEAETPSDSSEADFPTEGLVIEDDKLYVAIIWHQHQPVYFKDPETGIYERPWVRVHATKDYLDMVEMLQNYPDIHATFNLTPSLIRQLDDFSNGAKDLYWVMAEVPAEELTDEQKTFILEHFFDANPKIIDRFPRYAELAEMRTSMGVEGAVANWSAEDFRDLQVLFNLGWTDPDFLAEEPFASLVAKGEGYSEEDKAIIFAEHLRIIQEVIPVHASMQESGQIEVTMTPFAHPILPLLTDSNLASVALPDIDLPSQFNYGQDAIAQVELGVQFYEEHFGMAPRGMWPAEGSVAQIVVPMIANAGIQWIATDENVLAGSLPEVDDFTRDSNDTVLQADALYQPYLVEGVRGGPVAVIFRDHLISDLVGFEYSGTPGDEAALDLVTRLEAIKTALDEQGAEGPHLVTVLLDGENAWEYYDNDGKDFLNGMYALLSESETLVTVTPSEYLGALNTDDISINRIDDLFPGSWIDGTFSTWIGEEEENLGWEYLWRTRAALMEKAPTLDEATLEEAMTTLYIAEGSDWFWWYGSDQNSGADEDFDQQFRNYLEQIYLTIDEPVPSWVYVPIIPETAQQPDQQPLDLLSVNVDSSFDEAEWESSGYYELDYADLSRLYFGFSPDTLFMRLDGVEPSDDTVYGFYINLPNDSVASAYSYYGEGETTFGFGANRYLEVAFSEGLPVTTLYSADQFGAWLLVEGETGITTVVNEGVMEISAPFAGFAPEMRSGDRLNLKLVVSESGSDQAIFPTSGPALMVAPDLPIPNIFLEVTDPLDDDYGPGTYTYADEPIFRPGAFDIISFTIGYDEEDIIFRVAFDGPVDNVWGSPNGMSIQTIDIYIDTDGPGTGARLLLPGRNAALTADFGWDYAIWAEGWTPGLYIPGDEGPVEQPGEFTIIANPGQKRVTIRVPISMLEGDPTTWSYALVVGGQEGFPSPGVWRLRDVNPESAQWRFGGGPADSNHTRLMDILIPDGYDVTQEDLLGGYPSSTEDVDTLTPDDFPQVIMIPVGG